MKRSRVLVAVLLSALTACGDDNEDGSPDDGNPPAQTDRRQNVTGTYATTGTVEVQVLGNTQTQPLNDTVRVTKGTESDQALLLNVPTLSCDLRATMTGERTFTFNPTTCTVPPVNGCTVTANVTGGEGSRDASGTLVLAAQGTASAVCGGGLNFTGTFTLNATGTRTGD